jgi:hypothetical protein
MQHRTKKFELRDWVEVTAHREGGPDLQLIGRIVETTRDYAIAECRTRDGSLRFKWDGDIRGVNFRRMNNNDWAKRKRR